MEFTIEIKADGKTVTTFPTIPVFPEEGIPNELDYCGASLVFDYDGKQYGLLLTIYSPSDDTPTGNAWNAIARQINAAKRRSD